MSFNKIFLFTLLILLLPFFVLVSCDQYGEDDDFGVLREIDPISCDNGVEEIIMRDENILIDGNGANCIEASGNCELYIEATDIVLIDCDTCIKTKDSASVFIDSEDDFLCDDAEENGLNSEDDSEIIIETDDVFETSAEEIAVKAENDSEVEISADNCVFYGDYTDFDADFFADIELFCNTLH